MRRKISTTVYITDDQDTALKQLHERTKVPIAVYIRDGIDRVLRENGVNITDGELPMLDRVRNEAARR